MGAEVGAKVGAEVGVEFVTGRKKVPEARSWEKLRRLRLKFEKKYLLLAQDGKT